MSRRRRRRRRKGPRTEAAGPHPLAAGLATSLGEEALLHDGGRTDSSWWSRRWIQALEAFSGLGKARSQARREHVIAMHIEPGIVLAQVQSSKPEPHIVRADMTPLPPETWDEVIGGLAQKAVFAAKLLAGAMPEEIEEAFRDAGTSLLPRSSDELPTSCTCGEPAVCRHAAAVQLLLADEFGRNPFLIFRLRGCPKEQLLAALRLKRTGASAGEPAQVSGEPTEAEGLSPQAFWHGGEAIKAFAINIAPPMNHAALLRQLGPPTIEGGEAFLDMMGALYKSVMQSVLEDALKGQRPGPAPPRGGKR